MKLIIRTKNKKIYAIYIVIIKENKKVKNMDNKYTDESDMENDNLENKSDAKGKVINKKTIKEKTILYIINMVITVMKKTEINTKKRFKFVKLVVITQKWKMEACSLLPLPLTKVKSKKKLIKKLKKN